MSVGEVARKTLLSRKHFPTFLGVTMAVSAYAGFYSMDYIHKRKIEQGARVAEYRRHDREFAMSRNESMVRAMVENARSSSWKENLDNAFEAHERFMLGSKAGEPKFMEKIISRSEELRRQTTKQM